MVSRLLDEEAKDTIAASVKGRRVDAQGVVFRTLLQLSLVFALAILAILLISVVGDSWDQIGTRLGDLLQGTLRSRSEDEKLGVHQGIYGSLWIAIIVAVLAFPLGIAAAIYLEEYAPRNKLTSYIEV